MQYRPILNVGIGTDCDGFGVVSSNGGGEPDGGVFVEDYVANDGGVGCYPGRGSDARDVGSKFVYSFHLTVNGQPRFPEVRTLCRSAWCTQCLGSYL